MSRPASSSLSEGSAVISRKAATPSGSVPELLST
ncbi:hypothetical protein LINGRAHAP2_LOCUS14280 [Linum grandiflorum]